MNGIVGAKGTDKVQITVRENWGLRVVVRGAGGAEQGLWGKNLKRCQDNEHGLSTPYDSYEHNKRNRFLLRGVKVGTVVQHRNNVASVPPTGCAPGKSSTAWETSRVLRVIRAGSHQYVNYTQPAERCIHHLSVRLSARMLSRARRDNR